MSWKRFGRAGGAGGRCGRMRPGPITSTAVPARWRDRPIVGSTRPSRFATSRRNRASLSYRTNRRPEPPRPGSWTGFRVEREPVSLDGPRDLTVPNSGKTASPAGCPRGLRVSQPERRPERRERPRPNFVPGRRRSHLVCASWRRLTKFPRRQCLVAPGPSSVALAGARARWRAINIGSNRGQAGPPGRQ